MSEGQQQKRTETASTDGLEGEYDPEAVEARWQEYWVDQSIYAYDESIEDPNTVYSIDSS